MSGIVEKFANKKVLIWGYGVEGKSTEAFLNKYCKVDCIDIFEGKPKELNTLNYDYVIKSPGIPYFYSGKNPDIPNLMKAGASDELGEESTIEDIKLTSVTQLFLEEFRDRTIGITGTKGKSTTTSMLYKALSDNLDCKVCLLGNIGIPALDAYEEMKDGAIAVYEMSCHQLANTTVSPHIAIFLNLFEDHLDYYHTKDNYFEAKSHIALYQNEKDLLVKGENVPSIDTKAQIETVGFSIDRRFDLKIPGNHNQWNAKIAYNIAVNEFGCDEKEVTRSLCDFGGLPHRLEMFTQINNVKYYDDSISTIPEATINAIKSAGDVKTVIVGGMDRGIDYSVLFRGIREYSDINFILCYESGRRIYENVRECSNVYMTDNLEKAAKMAFDMTKSGSVILSPAAASYGYFKNFEERGDYFKSCIMLLQNEQ